MQDNSITELENRSIAAMAADDLKALESRARVLDVIGEMKEKGEVIPLSEEEWNMVQSFRRFKLRMRKQGEVFKWQTRRPDGVVLADTALIIDPSEAKA